MRELPGQSWADRIAWFIGSGFGCGLSPLAPGSVGSLAGMVILYLVSLALPADLSYWQRAALIGAMSAAGSVVGIWATGRMSTPDNPDPGSATWDEFVGMWLTCLFLPLGSPIWLASAFIVFRAFDVVKPWPCRRLERLPAGWGIMLDDVGAGAWGALVMLAAILLWRLIEPVAPGFLQSLLAY